MYYLLLAVTLVIANYPLIRAFRKLSMNTQDLNNAISALTQAVSDLSTRIGKLPGPQDLTEQVNAVNTLKTQVDGLAQPTP